MKYLIYFLLTVEGILPLFASYVLGYGVHLELANETSSPMPWLIIILCAVGILVLIVVFILQIINFRQINRMNKF